eukprot:TRINITY_DN489_c0_g1_i2.p1 TRINITY_DN489_c0_g1~~TRINITY_DN489_c0_g1_i2.p1  ORF type:complete len:217 (-),score=56.18 TRINITY_DN489_c0_g1_i2:16-666(-)
MKDLLTLSDIKPKNQISSFSFKKSETTPKEGGGGGGGEVETSNSTSKSTTKSQRLSNYEKLSQNITEKYKMTNEEKSELDERLENLASFQLSAIKHAFTFPSLQRLVYSTCSIHQIENEDVVQKALEESNGKFKLVKLLPNWKCRGRKEGFEFADYCIRSGPENHTIGFFVSCFERVTESDNVPQASPASTKNSSSKKRKSTSTGNPNSKKRKTKK